MENLILDDLPVNQNHLHIEQLPVVEIFSFGFKYGPSDDVAKNFNIR